MQYRNDRTEFTSRSFYAKGEESQLWARGSRLIDETPTVLRFRGVAHIAEPLPSIGSSTVSSNMKNATPPQAKQPLYVTPQNSVSFVNKKAALAARGRAKGDFLCQTLR
jgi:hypothetical protein